MHLQLCTIFNNDMNIVNIENISKSYAISVFLSPFFDKGSINRYSNNEHFLHSHSIFGHNIYSQNFYFLYMYLIE